MQASEGATQASEGAEPAPEGVARVEAQDRFPGHEGAPTDPGDECRAASRVSS